jgi:hypothetical protein
MTTAATTESSRFPYVGATGWLTRLHELFQRSVPAAVDIEWLTSTDRFSEKFNRKNASQLLSFMERVGWIDSEGQVQEEGRNLRLLGDPYQAAMRALLQRLYSELISQIEASEITDPGGVENYFVTTTEMGRSGRQQIIAVFRWFLREGGREDLEQKVWAGRRPPAAAPRANGSAPRRPPRRTSRTRAPAAPPATPPPAAPPAGGDGTTPESSPIDQRLAAISSVLKVNIDGTWDEARMRAALRWLDQLLKGEAIGD